jgi:hypothetical protein
MLWGLLGLLAEHFVDHDGNSIKSIHDSPCCVFIGDSQFMASATDRRHGPRVREADPVTALQPAKEHARFDSRRT